MCCAPFFALFPIFRYIFGHIVSKGLLTQVTSVATDPFCGTQRRPIHVCWPGLPARVAAYAVVGNKGASLVIGQGKAGVRQPH